MKLPYTLIFSTTFVFCGAFGLQAHAGPAVFSGPDCSPKILEITCATSSRLADGSALPIDLSEQDPVSTYRKAQEPSCDPEKSKLYGEALLKLYPKLPLHSRAAFCQIQKILVVSKVAYSGMVRPHFDLQNMRVGVPKDKDRSGIIMRGLRVNGFVLYLSEEWHFQRNESYLDALNRRFQRMFGVDVSKTGSSAELPKIISQSGVAFSELYATVVHEIGHMFSFSSRRQDSQAWNELPLEKRPPLWVQYSWQLNFGDRKNPISLGREDWEQIRALALGKQVIPISEWPLLLDTFSRTPFISFYSFSDYEEDFADFYLSLMTHDDLAFEKDGQILAPNRERLNQGIPQLKKEFILERLPHGFDGYEKVPSIRWVELDQPRP